MKKNVISVMLALFIAVLSSLTGCGGGGSGGDDAPANIVSGIVSAGTVLSGTVYLTDSSSPTKSLFTAIAADGSYSFDVTGLTKPYRLKAVGTTNGQYYTLYALAADIGTTNINQSTSLEVGSIPPPTTPNNPTTPTNPIPPIGSGTVTHPYFITTPGSVMTYSDGSTDTVLSNGNGVLTIESRWNDTDISTDDSIQTYIASGTNNIAMTSFTGVENNVPVHVIVSPAQLVFPSSLNVNWTGSQTVNWLVDGNSAPFTFTMTVMANDETVTVPAGTFTNVLKVHFIQRDEFNAVSNEWYVWFAPGIGPIKSHYVLDIVIIELASYIKK